MNTKDCVAPKDLRDFLYTFYSFQSYFDFFIYKSIGLTSGYLLISNKTNRI